MKKSILFGLLTAFILAGCGGSGGSDPTPTPTSDATKAASSAAANEAMSAAGEGAQNGFANLAPAAMVVKDSAAKDSYEGAISVTNDCDTGTVAVVGDMTAQCTGDPVGSWTCSQFIGAMTLTFSDCQRTVTVGSTPYSVTMNGTATSTVTGSASGVGATFTSVEFTGAFAGSLALTGGVTGTALLDNLGFIGVGASGADPESTCSGTTTITIDATEQVCAVSSDCSTCTE